MLELQALQFPRHGFFSQLLLASHPEESEDIGHAAIESCLGDAVGGGFACAEGGSERWREVPDFLVFGLLGAFLLLGAVLLVVEFEALEGHGGMVVTVGAEHVGSEARWGGEQFSKLLVGADPGFGGVGELGEEFGGEIRRGSGDLRADESQSFGLRRNGGCAAGHLLVERCEDVLSSVACWLSV